MLTLFETNEIKDIFLGEITKIEFDSVVWKKFRKGELNENMVIQTIKNFEKDCKKFNFIKDTTSIKKTAKSLITKYGKEGLRTLDLIQLATALYIKSENNIFITADKLLQKLFAIEGLKTV